MKENKKFWIPILNNWNQESRDNFKKAIEDYNMNCFNTNRKQIR